MGMERRVEALVVGGGLAGLSAAYFLARRGLRPWVLEREAPLSCTSDKSTEAYRLFWPGDEDLAALVRESLDLLPSFAEVARPNRRGYLYVGRLEGLEAMALEAPHAGPLRVHREAATYPKEAASGLDLLLPGALVEVFPYLGHLRGLGGLHVRPAGWLSAQGLGMALLERLRALGGRLVSGEFLGVEREGGRARSARVRREGREEAWSFGLLVLAPGPGLPRALQALGYSLPVTAEPHFKAWFPDPEGRFPREAPLLIWNEPQEIFAPEERALLEGEAELTPLLGPLPPGAHGRPEGEGFLALYNPLPREEAAPSGCLPSPPPFAGEVALRGLFPLLPGLRALLGVRPRVDGGTTSAPPRTAPSSGPWRRGCGFSGPCRGMG
ncbi:FAD dependent oxidoreductase [Thermus thermophilus]|nr:FAD dependent oxidoreductase [Thermus thermophilus]